MMMASHIMKRQGGEQDEWTCPFQLKQTVHISFNESNEMRDWMPNELEKKSQDEAAEEMEMDKGGRISKWTRRCFAF